MNFHKWFDSLEEPFRFLVFLLTFGLPFGAGVGYTEHTWAQVLLSVSVVFGITRVYHKIRKSNVKDK